MKKILVTLFACAAFFSTSLLKAEDGVSLSGGVDFVTAYMWRANNYGNSPAIQPWVSAGGYGAEFMVWGSQAIIQHGESPAFDEIDMVAKYTFDLGYGSLSLSATDFFYPHLGARFFNYKDYDSPNRGQHYINTGFEYNGPESFPIKITSDVAIHNDPNKPIYFELAYKFKVGENYILPFIGFVKEVGPANSFSLNGGDHTYFLDLDKSYKINKNRISCVNAGFLVKKTVKVTNDFSLPLEGQFFVNPYTEKAYFAFKVSL